MESGFKKSLRTLQSELPLLKDAKDGFYRHLRRLASIPHEADFWALRKIPPHMQGCFLDIGANQGQSIESILLMRPDANIVSFEANAHLARQLADRYQKRKNIRVIARALSNRPGFGTLFIPSYKGFVYDALASLDRTEAASWIGEHSVFAFNPARLVISEQQCMIDTLDALHLDPVFIKIDVQGLESRVLEGGLETLSRTQPMLLVESFTDDLRELVAPLGYEEHHWDGKSLLPGPPTGSPNSFLLTSQWKKILE